MSAPSKASRESGQDVVVAVALAIVAIAVSTGSLAAQPPLVVGPEVDPCVPGDVPMLGGPTRTPDGFAYTSFWGGTNRFTLIQFLHDDLTPDGPIRRVPGSVVSLGATTYLMRVASELRWMSRVDDSVLGSFVPLLSDVRLVPRGDDYVAVERYRLGVWRAGTPTSTITAADAQLRLG